MNTKNCPFCNIDELKTRIIDETSNTLIILSNPALVYGHCLAIPKRHVEKLSELYDYERKELFERIIKTQERLLRKFSGCDIRQNYRPFQTQSNLKVNHLHIHLQPRELNDELYTKCQVSETSLFKFLSSKELDKIREDIFET